MNDQHFFADVSLPFHFWVRERCGTRGYRWVLRKASDNEQGAGGPAGITSLERPPGASGGE
jgi:hypothetical protein